VDRGGQPEPVEDLRAHRLPAGTGEQPGPWIAPPVGGRGEHVPDPQCFVQLLEHAHHVGVAVHRTRGQIRVGVHRAAPHPRHQTSVDLAGLQRETSGPTNTVGVGVVLGAGVLPATLTAVVALLAGADSTLAVGATVGVLLVYALVAFLMTARSTTGPSEIPNDGATERVAVEPDGDIKPEKPSKVPVVPRKGAGRQKKATSSKKGKKG